MDVAFTAAEAAERLGLSKHTVGMWRSRGWQNTEGKRQKLTVVGHKNGAALLLWSEIVIAERDTRAKRNRSRRKHVRIPDLARA